MRPSSLSLVVALLTLLLPSAAPLRAEPYKSTSGPCEVKATLDEWRDAARGRVVPVKLYLPQALEGPAPVVVVSHGLGGSREGHAFIARHWASHGYAVVVLQHPGSDESVWRDKRLVDATAAMRSAASFEQLVARVADVRFAIDELTRRNATPGDTLAGKLDPARLAMAGHSFGAVTTQAVIGQRFGRAGGRELSFRDARVSAAVVMSPSDSRGTDDQAFAFGDIAVPAFYLTGTRDTTYLFPDEGVADRRVPFDHAARADAYLMVLDEGTHAIFNGGTFRARVGGGERAAREERMRDLIRQSTTAFLDAHLRGDEVAKAWLRDGEFAKEMSAAGTFEAKSPQPALTK